MNSKRIASRLANILTVTRIGLVPFFIVFLFGEGVLPAALALAVFLIAASSDYFDGYIARRYGTQSRFGEFLDPLADKILTGSAFISFALIPGLGVPLWLVLIIILREVLLTLLRALAIRKGRPVKTELAGKIKTGFHMFAIICILSVLFLEKSLIGVPGPVSGIEAALPLILVALSAFVALISMVSYLEKNRDVFLPAQALRKRGKDSEGAEDRNEKRLLRGFVIFLSTGSFIGYIPHARGTVAAIAGSLLWILVPDPVVYSLVAVITAVSCFFIAGYAEKNLFGEKDSQKIVLDELAGILVTYLSFSFTPTPFGYTVYATGLVLFRIFDIGKPPPLRNLQRLSGGAGVLLDDIGAAVFANAVLQVLRIIWHRFV